MNPSTPFWFQDPPSFFSSLVPGAFILWVGVAAGTGTLPERYSQARTPAAAQIQTQDPAPLSVLPSEHGIGLEQHW